MYTAPESGHIWPEHAARIIVFTFVMLRFTFRRYFGNINFFGGDHVTSVKSSVRLKQIEEANEDAMFVILSDLWLDRVKVKV